MALVVPLDVVEVLAPPVLVVDVGAAAPVLVVAPIVPPWPPLPVARLELAAPPVGGPSV
jgi:hypothetical protein